MTIKEQFEIEWAKLSTLKDPIFKETAWLFYRLGALTQMNKTSQEIKSIHNRINEDANQIQTTN